MIRSDAGIYMFGKCTGISMVLVGMAVGAFAQELVMPEPETAGQAAMEASAPPDESSISLSVMVQEERIILLWTPPNQAPSDGIKVTRALAPDFAPETVDQYTKWLPGTGYSQCILFPSAASDKTFYYRVTSVVTGREAVCLGVSNPVRVEAAKKKDDLESASGEQSLQNDWTAP